MLRVQTFGGVSLESAPGGPITIGRRPRALLALLAASGERGLSRDKIVALLWPESDAERGRNSLSQVLSALRRELKTDRATIGTMELRLNPDIIANDVDEFEHALATQDIDRAAAIYVGPFLDGFYLRGAAEFERWVEENRSRFHHTLLAALRKHAKQAEHAGDHAAAARLWRRIAALEPSAAYSALGLMTALVAAGDRAGALQHYRLHETMLRDDLGVDPDNGVAAFAARIRNVGGLPASQESSATTIAQPEYVSEASSADSVGLDKVRAAGFSVTWIRARKFLVGAVAMIIGVAVLALRAKNHSSYNRREVAVSRFANRTGDSTLNAFGFLAADFIIDGLQRSRLAQVTDAATLVLITGRVLDSASSADDMIDARRMGDATRAGLIVTGHYFKEGDSVTVVARIQDLVEGTVVASTEPIHVTPNAPAQGLQRLRQRVLGILAVRLETQLADVLPAGASPPTLAAYAEYVDGLLEFQRQNFAGALPHFVRAYELDSSFVAPLMWQAFALSHINRSRERAPVIRELASHRSALTALDRAALDHFEAVARRDMLGDIAALQRASALAPGSIWTWNLGNALNQLGRSQEAVVAFDQLDRSHGWIRNWRGLWGQYARALHYVDHRRELQLVREGQTVLPKGSLRLDEMRALAGLGQQKQLDSLVIEVAALPATPESINSGNWLDQIAMELWNRGDTAYSRIVIGRALEWFRAQAPDIRLKLRANFGAALYDADQWSEARPIFEQLLSEDPNNWDALTHLGLCLARQGERQQATEIMNRIIVAADSVTDGNLVITSANIRAARIAAVLGEKAKAVSLVQVLNARTGGVLSRHVQHKDFDSLRDYPPFLAITRPVK